MANTIEQPKTLDLTPTWEGLMPALIAVLQNGVPEGQKIASDELMRLAKWADIQNGDNRLREMGIL